MNFDNLSPISAAFRNLTCLTLMGPNCTLRDSLVQMTRVLTTDTQGVPSACRALGPKHVKTCLAPSWLGREDPQRVLSLHLTHRQQFSCLTSFPVDLGMLDDTLVVQVEQHDAVD